MRIVPMLAALLLSACALVQPIPSQPHTAPQVEAPAATPPHATPPVRATSTPYATPYAGASAAPQPSSQPAAGIATLETLATVELPIRDQVQLAYEFGRTTTLTRVARTTPLEVQVGDVETFFISDQANNSNYTIEATLVLALEHVLVYVEKGLDLDLAALERSARQFNDQIYPRNRELFGSEWTPGVDGDPRLTILNARIPGSVGGYFSGSDEVPRSVNPFSNEREMFYINIDSYLPGTDEYASVLAHEFQHMIHWNEQRAVPTWFNEGLSQLAEELNGFDPSSFAVVYLANPDVQLTTWAEEQEARLPHYAASYLFLSYFYEQYGDLTDLPSLIHANAGYHLEPLAEVARRRHPDIASFSDLYADWAVANLVNDGRYAGGRYHYRHLPTTVQPLPLRSLVREQVAQFGSDYWQFEASDRERVLRFDGSDQVGLIAATPDGQALWWSNRGDSTHTWLSRSFDLRHVSSATLHYRLWYDLEEHWDYGFVSVSTDGGQTFTPLETRYTTRDDPQGYNYGHAYTGRSGGEPARWIDEQVDLTPFVGQQVIVRFSMITDDAVNRPGLAIDNIRLPEIGFVDDVEQPRDGWTAQGWVRTDNRLPQRWELRLVRIGERGVTFEEVALDADNRAEVRIAPGERGALVICGATPLTSEPASYTLQLEE